MSNKGGVGKISSFLSLCMNISKAVADTAVDVACHTNDLLSDDNKKTVDLIGHLFLQGNRRKKCKQRVRKFVEEFFLAILLSSIAKHCTCRYQTFSNIQQTWQCQNVFTAGCTMHLRRFYNGLILGAGADGTDAVISVVEAALSFKSRSIWPIFALPSSIPVFILKHIRSIFFIEEKTYI